VCSLAGLDIDFLVAVAYQLLFENLQYDFVAVEECCSR
jgi:hypothetical protein